MQNLEEILRSIVKRSIQELHDDLYPKKLGKAIERRTPEQRIVTIAKYEGRAEVLQELGADIKELENKIDEELKKF